MGSRFIVWLMAAFLSTLGLLGGIGYAASMIWVAEPRDIYRNPAFEFPLAKGWWCETDGTEDVCYPPGEKPHRAIAVIAIKLRNDQDNLDAYEAHLRAPQPIGAAKAGTPQLSEVRYVRREMLGGRQWVTSLHANSEIENFHTYYLATATSHLGILVTLSVHKDHADRFIGEFTAMMSSLEAYQK
jgi:hypothetical protein